MTKHTYSLVQRLKRSLRDKQGNVFMLTGLSLIPITLAAGLAVDYTRAARLRTKLDSAADAAVLQAVSDSATLVTDKVACERAAALFNAQATQQKDTIYSRNTSFKLSVGSPAAPNNSVYNPQTNTCSSPVAGGQAVSPQRVVNLSYNVQSLNYFGQLANRNTLNVSGGSRSEVSVPQNIDFFVALDTSPSMALPVTTDGLSKMTTSVSCAFACHTNQGFGNVLYDGYLPQTDRKFNIVMQTPQRTGKYQGNDIIYVDAQNNFIYRDGQRRCDEGGKEKICTDWAVYRSDGYWVDTYWYARNRGITMRIDELRRATAQLAITATTQAVKNDATYRAAVFAFDYDDNFRHIFGFNEQNQTPLMIATKNPSPQVLANAANFRAQANSTAIEIAELDDRTEAGCPATNCGGGNNYLFTSYRSLLDGMAAKLPTASGNGTRATNDTPQAILFIVTDGMSDEKASLVSGLYSNGSDRTRSELSGVRNGTPASNSHQAKCQAIKDRNIKIAILYTEYTAESIESDHPGQKNWVMGRLPNVENALEKCATPGLMFKVSTDADIAEKLSDLFRKAVATPRLVR
jgi:Flp pilus assembly protein TadG